MSNLIQLQAQIEQLQQQAQEIRAKEFASTVQDILAKMQAFGITVKDLQITKVVKGNKGKVTAAAKKTKSPKRAVNVVAAKYRGPNGETWSGRGLTPKWLSALIAQGQSKELFAVNAQ